MNVVSDDSSGFEEWAIAIQHRTGGGALVGFHLKHRETSDLDLFTASVDAFERAHVTSARLQKLWAVH